MQPVSSSMVMSRQQCISAVCNGCRELNITCWPARKPIVESRLWVLTIVVSRPLARVPNNSRAMKLILKVISDEVEKVSRGRQTCSELISG